MSTKLQLERVSAAVFLVCLVLIVHDAKYSVQDPGRWLSAGFGPVVAVLLVVSAVSYVWSRRKNRQE